MFILYMSFLHDPKITNRRGSSGHSHKCKVLLEYILLFQEKDVTPDSTLLRKVRDAALQMESLSPFTSKATFSSTTATTDFFLALAICNTVVVSTATEPRQRVI